MSLSAPERTTVGNSTRVPLNVIDNLILNLGVGEPQPWSVHYELSFEGRLDPARLAAAIQAACDRHPMARARLAPVRSVDRRREWVISERSVGDALTVVDCADDDALSTVRGQALSRQFDLIHESPVAITLARGPRSDDLIMNLDHAAGDGMSASRLMTSIARTYTGAPDPVPEWDPLSVRTLRQRAGARSRHDVALRSKGLRDRVRESRQQGPLARVARTAAPAPPEGFGFVTIALTAEETSAAMSLKTAPATVNDLLVASLAITIEAFNAQHGLAARTVGVMMPVSLRDRSWFTEVVSNIVSFVSVAVPTEVQHDLVAAQAAVADRTRALKDNRRAGTLIDILDLIGLTPLGLGHVAAGWIGRRSVARVLDTAVLSNLGRLDAPHFGTDAGKVTGLWFSPPAQMPLGVATGAATVGDQLYLTVRYCHAQFDRAGAESFASLWREKLTAG